MASLDNCPNPDDYFPSVGDSCTPGSFFRDLKQTIELLKQCVIDQQEQINELLLSQGSGGGGANPTIGPVTVTSPADASPLLDTNGNYENCRATVVYSTTVTGANGDDNAGALALLSSTVQILCDGQPVGDPMTFNEAQGGIGNGESYSLTGELTFTVDCVGLISVDVLSETAGGTVNGQPPVRTHEITASAFCVAA